MRTFCRTLPVIASLLFAVGPAAWIYAQDSGSKPTAASSENKCLLCHGDKEMWAGEDLRLFVAQSDLAADIHWQKGLRCKDCHGGNDQTEDKPEAHSKDAGFHTVSSPADVPKFCGDCHSNIEFMRRYRPSPRIDQLAEYWTSAHGKRLKATGDPDVATCISCHDKPHGSGQDKTKHGIRLVTELESLVYRTRVAKTCATCHSDRQRMKERLFQGRPLPCDEYDKWRQSVHGKAMMDKGDLSAATCNNCHGNHGAVPPQVGSVANACGVCHGKVADLFEKTLMKHKFEEVGLPGCVTCHGNHDISQPSDAMLGMGNMAVCTRCHEKGAYGATIAGAQTARKLRASLEQLKKNISIAENTLDKAEQLGMEVSQPRYELRNAVNALTNARSLIHAFELKPVETAVAGGEKVTVEVQDKADRALAEHTARRIWLAASMVPIMLVIALLLLYIRTLPAPK